MEDPQRILDDNPLSEKDTDAEERQRRAEEAMEQMLLEQEDEENDDKGPDHGDALRDDLPEENDDDEVIDDDLPGFDDDEESFVFHEDSVEKKSPFTYVRISFWSAVFLIYYAFRSRQQWYLALVFLSSSKYAYVVLGNAFVAALVWVFRVTTDFFLNGLRLTEAEGLTDFFRWHITETCLALTIFRSDLTVKTFIFFLILVLAKCLHYIVDARESHLRMTEEIVVPNPTTGWIGLRLPQVKLFALICTFQILDIGALVLCAQDIMKYGNSPSILFGFESAIMLTSVISNGLLWNLHLMDGIFHYLHETSPPGALFHRWIHTWKDHKATLVFAVELQAQAAKFLFYLVFFATVMTNYGLPINLIREVYVSFLSLKQRVLAFHKYRKLMAGMNRYKNPTEEELEDERICIICRDEMTVDTAKRLPGCGHIMHKSCLREWLVQQQTCPTCRSDIQAMEARQSLQDRQDRMNAARAQQQQGQGGEQEPNQQNGESSSGAEEKASDDPTNNATDDERIQPGSVDNHESVPTNSSNSKSLSGLEQWTTPATMGTKSVGFQSAFPAFYRVVQDSGASVHRYNDDDGSSVALRVVPSGVIVLGMEIQYRKLDSANHMMIKIPDGWLCDDDVERIVAVPLESPQ